MNKTIEYYILFFISIFVLNSCSYKNMMKSIIPKEEVKFAEDYLNKVRERKFDFIKSKLSDELKPEATNDLLTQLADNFRNGDLISAENIGSSVNVVNGAWKGNFTFEYHFTDGWNIANVVFRKIDNDYKVIGINVYKTEMSQGEINAFKLAGKSFLQYLILILAISVPLFISITAYFCIRTPIAKRKWLWIIFILFGIGAFKINWTNNKYKIQITSFHLLGASVVKNGPYAPWNISASLPLGGILFWIRRKKLNRTNDIISDAE